MFVKAGSNLGMAYDLDELLLSTQLCAYFAVDPGHALT